MLLSWLSITYIVEPFVFRPAFVGASSESWGLDGTKSCHQKATAILPSFFFVQISKAFTGKTGGYARAIFEVIHGAPLEKLRQNIMVVFPMLLLLGAPRRMSRTRVESCIEEWRPFMYSRIFTRTQVDLFTITFYIYLLSFLIYHEGVAMIFVCNLHFFGGPLSNKLKSTGVAGPVTKTGIAHVRHPVMACSSRERVWGFEKNDRNILPRNLACFTSHKNAKGSRFWQFPIDFFWYSENISQNQKNWISIFGAGNTGTSTT